MQFIIKKEGLNTCDVSKRALQVATVLMADLSPPLATCNLKLIYSYQIKKRPITCQEYLRVLGRGRQIHITIFFFFSILMVNLAPTIKKKKRDSTLGRPIHMTKISSN